jgi:hypothetical protein
MVDQYLSNLYSWKGKVSIFLCALKMVHTHLQKDLKNM